jgi:hypothetical protein
MKTVQSLCVICCDNMENHLIFFSLISTTMVAMVGASGEADAVGFVNLGNYRE